MQISFDKTKCIFQFKCFVGASTYIVIAHQFVQLNKHFMYKHVKCSDLPLKIITIIIHIKLFSRIFYGDIFQ